MTSRKPPSSRGASLTRVGQFLIAKHKPGMSEKSDSKDVPTAHSSGESKIYLPVFVYHWIVFLLSTCILEREDDCPHVLIFCLKAQLVFCSFTMDYCGSNRHMWKELYKWMSIEKVQVYASLVLWSCSFIVHGSSIHWSSIMI